MDEKQSISIDDIYQSIVSLDHEGKYKGVSYNLTPHNTLAQNAWWVFIPYGQWEVPLTTPNPSPLENAILQAIPYETTNECFIDIVTLIQTDAEFINDSNATHKIVNALANYINSLPESVTPVIRYLVGNSQAVNPDKDPAKDPFINALFSGNYFTNIKNKNACFYYGNFAPDARLSTAPSSEAPQIPIVPLSVTSLIEKVIEFLQHIGDLIDQELIKYKAEIQAFLREIEKRASEIGRWIWAFVHSVGIETVSWNHSKIFAVNGSSLVTGGANYWQIYQTQEEWLFDMSMSITGDAAIDAHRFADIFWDYLNNRPLWDQQSFCKRNLLAQQITNFTDTTSAPMFEGSPQNTGNISVLSVGKNGNWPLQDFGFPALLFDATRDFIINIFAAFAEAKFNQKEIIVAWLSRTFSDDNPEFTKVLHDIGISPAAWASRYARNRAIKEAQRSVKFSQQKFAMDDLVTLKKSGYMQLIRDINTAFGINWNGYIWPYDLLMALGYALSQISNNSKDSTTWVEIVTSCPKGPNDKSYEDAINATDFKDKLAEIMKGMQQLGYINPDGNTSDIIQNNLAYLHIDPHITNPEPKHGNHSKLFIVDDCLCYIGSDNTYPSYNQEFGILIDDQPSIQSFLTNYWNGLWSFAQQNQDSYS